MQSLNLIKVIFSVLVYLSSYHFCLANNNAEYLIDNQVFKLPGNGNLSINIPRAWGYSFTFSDKDQPPLITFTIPGNVEVFQLNLSVLWDDSFSRNVTSPEYIRSLVEKTGEKILAYSDEKELVLNEISGTTGKGFIYDLTDSTAEEGEYRHLTQGAISLGEVLLIFSLFTNNNKALFRSATLSAIKSARHYYRKDV